MNAGAHLAWLVDAIRQGAKRHDGFEIERHFALSNGAAVRLGELLHDVAGGGDALAAIDAIVVEYRSANGNSGRISVACEDDGRLGAPVFS